MEYHTASKVNVGEIVGKFFGTTFEGMPAGMCNRKLGLH